VEPLERAIVLFTERGYPDANLGLSPGSASGSTALTMRWSKARAPWAASVSTDNSASRYTGTIRLLGDASAYSLATQGDQLSVRASLSGLGGLGGSNSGNTQFLSLGYSLPLGFDGWRIGANASALNYKLGGTFAALQASGDAKSFGLNASYPLALSANSQSLLDLSLLQRRAVDDSLAGNVNDKATRVAMLAHSYSRSSELAGKGFNQRLQSAFSAGRLDLARNAGAAAFDAANAAAAGRFAKLRFDYTAAYAVSVGHQLQARLSQQFASKNLDSSEKISLGGANGVRAYPVGEANGDGGTLLSLEWRADLSQAFSPAPGLVSSLTPFVDWGQIKQNQRPWAAAVATSAITGIANTYNLSGAGLTYSLGRPGDWQLSATLAAPLSRNPGRNPKGLNSDGRGQHPRAWLSFQKSL
jgi:hemolysin activation/secretion protein